MKIRKLTLTFFYLCGYGSSDESIGDGGVTGSAHDDERVQDGEQTARTGLVSDEQYSKQSKGARRSEKSACNVL